MIVKRWKYNDMENKMSRYGDMLSYMAGVVAEFHINENGRLVEDETVDMKAVKVEIIKETEKAVQLRVADVWSEWFPKSAIVEW